MFLIALRPLPAAIPGNHPGILASSVWTVSNEPLTVNKLRDAVIRLKLTRAADPNDLQSVAVNQP